MKRWPLLLPPPAVSTSPSRSRRSSSSIIVKSPSPCSSPLSCRRAVNRRSAAPSITVHSPSHRPSPPIAVVLSVHRRRARAVPCRRGAVPRRRSLALEEPSRRPSLLRSRRAIPRHRGAVATSIAVERRTSQSRIRRLCRLTNLATRHAPPRPLIRLVVALPLLTPPPSICRRLSLQPSPFVPLVRLAGCSVSSILTPPPPHRAIASSCHAHLGHLVRLVKGEAGKGVACELIRTYNHIVSSNTYYILERGGNLGCS
jgi:hypothetical protein